MIYGKYTACAEYPPRSVIFSIGGAGIVGWGEPKSNCGATEMKENPKKPAGSRERREEEERRLDEAIEESFPASDPLPTTGTFAGAPDDRLAKSPHKRLSQKKPV